MYVTWKLIDVIVYVQTLRGILSAIAILRQLTAVSGLSTASGSGSGIAAAKQKCLDATKKIQNSTARSTAEQACNQITTSNASVSAARNKAEQACLTAAEEIPIASLKHSAQAQCKKIAAP